MPEQHRANVNGRCHDHCRIETMPMYPERKGEREREAEGKREREILCLDNSTATINEVNAMHSTDDTYNTQTRWYKNGALCCFVPFKAYYYVSFLSMCSVCACMMLHWKSTMAIIIKCCVLFPLLFLLFAFFLFLFIIIICLKVVAHRVYLFLRFFACDFKQTKLLILFYLLLRPVLSYSLLYCILVASQSFYCSFVAFSVVRFLSFFMWISFAYSRHVFVWNGIFPQNVLKVSREVAL